MRRVFRTNSFTMGLTFEMGWVHLGHFDLDGGTNTDGLVDDHQGGLGRLSLSGLTINAGLVLRGREWTTRSFRTPIHPGSLCCQAVEYSRYAPFWRLASRAPRRPDSR
ncbi:MAG: hypothetical protein ABI333_05580, partial [bacterium]